MCSQFLSVFGNSPVVTKFKGPGPCSGLAGLPVVPSLGLVWPGPVLPALPATTTGSQGWAQQASQPSQSRHFEGPWEPSWAFRRGMLSFRPSFGGACCHSEPVSEGHAVTPPQFRRSMLSFRSSFGGVCYHSALVSERHAVTPSQFRRGMLSFRPKTSPGGHPCVT